MYGWDCWACLQVHGSKLKKTCVHLNYPYGFPSPWYGPVIVTGGSYPGAPMGGIGNGKRDEDEVIGDEEV